MHFRIERQPWIIGQWTVPPGTEINSAKPDQWTEIVRGKVPPLNAVALDQECFDLMWAAYQWGGRDQIHVGRGVRKR
jgi:hypothetical protein